MDYLLEWRGADGKFTESAEVRLGSDGLTARGTQIGWRPAPYRLDYELEADASLHTVHCSASATGAGWSRRLVLERRSDGTWTAEVGGAGEEDLLGTPAAICDELEDAVDCDIGFSPLTNTMPIVRNKLHETDGSVEVSVAWVSVPHLTMRRARQSYTHLSKSPGGAVVRYRSLESDFEADLDVDRAGLVRRYPGLAERIAG